jgi:putative ATP-dependent endonuclease of OLD family
MTQRSKLVKMRIVNLGCIGPEGLTVDLDNILCLVGPNNSGKSTVLRAYELAVGTQNFDKDDFCLRGNDEPSTVEIWVHIPEGMASIAEEWKEIEGDLRLVRSKWEWTKDDFKKPVRKTWDTKLDDYSETGNAAGLDQVFTSRLPQPFRIGALDNPEAEHKKLLTLILEPIADQLKQNLEDPESGISIALKEFTRFSKQPVEAQNEHIQKIKEDINKSHNEIFPNISIDLNIGINEIKVDPLAELLKSSKFKIKEWADEIDWNKQGTGSQRALFWSMMQVRSRLKTVTDLKNQQQKEIAELAKQVSKLQKERDKARTEATVQDKTLKIEALEKTIEEKSQQDVNTLLENQNQELSLPGHMLLIDEPEIALHPNAIRAASKYLYALAQDPSWQVMLTTHSPLFVNPLEDHTTVVRLDREHDHPTPKTYVSDKVSFSESEKENLKMLNKFDSCLAEMFFGQYPILVEGDTEFAAFEAIMNKFPDKYPINKRPIIIRARGKFTLTLLSKMLNHFKVPYSILHDCDSPLNKNGKKNNAWTANKQIHAEVKKTRESGIKVNHKVSIPYFEGAHTQLVVNDSGIIEDGTSKDKPFEMWQKVMMDEGVQNSVIEILDQLMPEAEADVVEEEDFDQQLINKLKAWKESLSITDARYAFKD